MRSHLIYLEMRETKNVHFCQHLVFMWLLQLNLGIEENCGG